MVSRQWHCMMHPGLGLPARGCVLNGQFDDFCQKSGGGRSNRTWGEEQYSASSHSVSR